MVSVKRVNSEIIIFNNQTSRRIGVSQAQLSPIPIDNYEPCQTARSISHYNYNKNRIPISELLVAKALVCRHSNLTCQHLQTTNSINPFSHTMALIQINLLQPPLTRAVSFWFLLHDLDPSSLLVESIAETECAIFFQATLSKILRFASPRSFLVPSQSPSIGSPTRPNASCTK